MQAPDVVVVGAATRDLTEEDPRGWTLGGGVTFGALALARLGLHVGLVLGLDEVAATARELDLIRAAGADITAVPLRKGPIFTNVETLAGRIQTCGSTSDPIDPAALPVGWRQARAWVMAPVASEIPETWATVPPQGSCVALGWQGMLRDLRDGQRVRPLALGPSPLLARADIVAVSRHDVPADTELRTIGSWLAPRADVLLTAGLLGGMLLRFERGQLRSARVYPSIPSRHEVDPTGAGDTMLAGFVAARLVGGREAGSHGRELFTGAAAASLLVEGPGMDSVPTLHALRARIRPEATSET